MKTAVVQAQQKWECHYVTAYSEVVLLQILNEAGAEGWEPFGVSQYKDTRGTMSWMVLLKRPSTGQAPPKVPGEATTDAARSHETASQPKGFDLEGDTFDVVEETPAPKPAAAKPAVAGAKPAAAPAKPGQPVAAPKKT